MESFIIYGLTFLICGIIIFIYLKKLRTQSDSNTQKIEQAKTDGVHEPVSLYPYINEDTCIKSGACVIACPEHEIIGIQNGRATLINASRCIGHGACFHACPVEAISLRIGTEKRGVDLPHVNQNFETNVRGLFIAGELGGMGLIKNSVEQGKQAIGHISASMDKKHSADYDIIIIGAGPAGIAASLQAKNLGLKTITLEQDSLGGTVYNFPRAKIVMTSPMDLPLYGKIKLFQTSKSELLELWTEVISKNNIAIEEHTKVEEIIPQEANFLVKSQNGKEFSGHKVLLAIGRRGTPRKLGVKGEQSEKVAYKLIEPELIVNQNVLVVGGGDSAIESALLLSENNNVSLSYRSPQFSRIKPLNAQRIDTAMSDGSIKVYFESNIIEIQKESVLLKLHDESTLTLANDLVYIFAGGELPTQFLEKAGIKISKRFNYTMLSHQNKPS